MNSSTYQTRNARFLQQWTGFFLAAVVLSTFGCVDEKEPSLFDPNGSFSSPPVLSLLAPADSAQAGVDTLTITGSNFSSVPGNNVTFFNSTLATPLQASSTALLIKAPLVIGDSVAIRVGVRNSVVLSNTLVYKLRPAVELFGLLGQSDLANSLMVSSTGDVYVSISVGGTGQGIRRIAPDGTVNFYAPDTTGVTGWSGLKFGPGGYLYGARGIRAIYRFPPGGGSPAFNPWVAFPSGVTINDIDFDQNQILWAAGSNTSSITNARVYSVSQTPVTKSFPFAATVRSLRVFGSYLYMAALENSKWGIWRAQIAADSLRTPELYFDFDAAFSSLGYTPQGITFSSNGDLYIATEAPAGFVVVTSSQNVIVPYGDYKALFGTAVKYLAWGTGTKLYAATAGGVLLRIEARRTGAPYFGP